VVSTWLTGDELVAELACPQAGPAARAAVDALAQALAEAFDAVTEHCTRPGAGSVAPSDFPLAGLDSDSLAAFLGAFSGKKADSADESA